MVDDERAWIDAIADGDEAAFQALYTAYYTRLWRYAWYQLGGQTNRVEDVLQEVFFAIWRAAEHFRGEARVATWIFQIAHNVVSTARHKQSRQLDDRASALPDALDDGDGPDAPDASFEDATVNRLLLIEAIDHLSTKHQTVIYLVFVQGFSLAEVARILDVPQNTVKSRILGARRALIKQLDTAGLVAHGVPSEGGRA